MQEMTEMEIRCERRGQKAVKWKKRRADGVTEERHNVGIEGGVEEDEGTERLFLVIVSATSQ